MGADVSGMSFQTRGEAVIAALDRTELKLIYRVLHRHLSEHTDLMDTHFLIELQRFLHSEATREGVDVSDHGAWDRWLGNESAPACAQRVERRREIKPD